MSICESFEKEEDRDAAVNSRKGLFTMRGEDDYNYIAKALRQFRVQADFSQQNMADMLNLNRSTYTYYETGKTTPDIGTLYKISRILGVPVEYFFPPERGETLLSDSKWDNEKVRPGKKISADPQRVGDLSPEEKSLIALIRSDDRISTPEIIRQLREALERADGRK